VFFDEKTRNPNLIRRTKWESGGAPQLPKANGGLWAKALATRAKAPQHLALLRFFKIKHFSAKFSLHNDRAYS